jgi:lipopolysaccharide transport system ATP-binding protein
MESALIVKSVSKLFRRPDPNRPHTLQEWLVRGLRRRQTGEQFWALREVSFTIPPGRMVGLIGHNGAGKSTLLRLIGGIGRAESGEIVVNGRIGALLDLGSGLNDDLTGRENVYLNGVIGGLTRRQVTDRFDDIVNFAELAAVIDASLRTYSTGMKMRLAFAVAVHIDPDILLIDEVLAVGDIAFQRKCMERIAQFRQQGCTILLVTHDASVVRELCDEAIWLENGRIAAHGRADLVVADYVAAMASETQRRTPTPTAEETGPLRLNETRFGSQEMVIEAVTLLAENGRIANSVRPGEGLTVRIAYDAPQPIASPHFSASITTGDGTICCDLNTAQAGLTLPMLQGKGQIDLHIERLELAGGCYYVDVGVHETNWAYAYDYHWHVYSFDVPTVPGELGLIRPSHRWHIGK